MNGRPVTGAANSATLRSVQSAVSRNAFGVVFVLLGACTENPPPDADAGVDATTDVSVLEQRIEVLTMVPNPENVLSFTVTWTTPYASSSSVTVTAEDGAQFRFGDPAPVTAHRVFVFGLHAEQTYAIEASSEAPDQPTVHASGTHSTPALPDEIPTITLDVPRTDGNRDWTLFGIQVLAQPSGTIATMVDHEGRVVWYRFHREARGVGPVMLLDAGTRVLIGVGGQQVEPIEVDLEGREVWRGPEGAVTREGEIHHDFRRLVNGNYGVLRYTLRENVLGDVLEEMSPTGVALWRWDVFDHLTPGTGDWTHGNAADFESAPGHVIFSAPALNAVFKISRSTGEIIWRLGEGGDFAADPDADEPWFSFQHDPNVLPNGNVLLYDNGRDRAEPSTRVLEYALDEEAMAARIVFTYPPSGSEDVWFTRALGGVTRLPNGNTVITAGSIDVDPRSRIFEVTPSGMKVFQISIAPIGVSASRVFRSQRFAPLVSPVEGS